MMTQISEEMVWNQIVARAWCDDDFMKRLLAEPRAVLGEHDLTVPVGIQVEVLVGPDVRIDDTDSVRRFIMPGRPPQELIEEELVGDAVAYYSYSRCAACGRCGYCGCRCRC